MSFMNVAKSSTTWNLGFSVLVMTLCAMAISLVPKEKRKGASYSFIVMMLIGSIAFILLNTWKLAKETGAKNAMNARWAAWRAPPVPGAAPVGP
jgi:lipopolysaccharide export LptBFGC system permease protein LptF